MGVLIIGAWAEKKKIAYKKLMRSALKDLGVKCWCWLRKDISFDFSFEWFLLG